MVTIESGKRRRERIDPAVSPRAVLAPEFQRRVVPLRAAWVGTLKDKRHISAAIRHLTRVLPGMSHLKRCSGKRLVLGFAAPISVDNSSAPALPTVGNPSPLQLQELEELLGEAAEDFERSSFEAEFEIVAVPASAPRTKAQARAASEIWPLNFHPDPYVEKTLSGSCFAPDDLRTIDRCVRLCIEAARLEARGNEDCTGSAIVFDPRRGKIVAIAASRIDVHPMWHAAILAVDLVARLQGGGAYDLVGESVAFRKRKHTGSRPEIRPPVAFPAGLLELAKREDSTSGCEIEDTGSRAELRLPASLLESAKREDSTSSGEIEETGSRPEIRLPAELLEPAKREDSTSGREIEETGSRAELRLPAKREDSTSGCEIEDTGSRAELRLPAELLEPAKREDSTSGCEIEETGSRPEIRLPAELLEPANREDSTSGREIEETGSRAELRLPAGLLEPAKREDSTSGCEIEETGSRPEIRRPAGPPELERHEGDSTSACEVEETGSGVELQLPVTSADIEGQEIPKNGRSEYLCTNYWAFLLREPCPLCAMALVHSRVSDIFWGAENECRGVLGSKALLHAVPGLNHRYRVWRGVREEECRRACAEIFMRR